MEQAPWCYLFGSTVYSAFYPLRALLFIRQCFFVTFAAVSGNPFVDLAIFTEKEKKTHLSKSLDGEMWVMWSVQHIKLEMSELCKTRLTSGPGRLCSSLVWCCKDIHSLYSSVSCSSIAVVQCSLSTTYLIPICRSYLFTSTSTLYRS